MTMQKSPYNSQNKSTTLLMKHLIGLILYPFTEEAITGSQVASIDDIKHYNLVAIVKTTITNRGLKRILGE